MTQARDLADGKFDTNTLVVDAANNRVGIGTTSPDRSLHITNSEPSIVLENSGQGTDLKTWRMYSNSSSLQIGTVDDAFAAGQNALEITRDNTDNITGIQFKTGASSEIGRFTTDGLTFNGDTAAANALDDYEEGTWTPTADSNITFSGSPSGNYIKVGGVVMAFVSLTCNLTNGQDIQIGGLPFAPAANNEPVLFILNNTSTYNRVPRGRTATSSQIKARSPATVSGINLMIQATYRV